MNAPRRRPLRLTQPEPSEAAILSAVLIRLQYDRRVAWCQRMNTGAHAVGEGKSRRYIRYGFPGCSDIIGQLKDGRFLAVECKRPSGRCTAAQAAFLDQVRANGGVAGVVRSVVDIERLLPQQAPLVLPARELRAVPF